jgi:hypothetical protein
VRKHIFDKNRGQSPARWCETALRAVGRSRHGGQRQVGIESLRSALRFILEPSKLTCVIQSEVMMITSAFGSESAQAASERQNRKASNRECWFMSERMTGSRRLETVWRRLGRIAISPRR